MSKHEPEAWMWQHEETGRTGFVDQFQIDNGFEQANPRLQIICPLYRDPDGIIAAMQQELERLQLCVALLPVKSVGSLKNDSLNYATQATGEEVMNYHDRIMNLLAGRPSSLAQPERAYKEGHRDARHAAAEIAIEADRIIAEQQQELERLQKDAERYRWIRDQHNNSTGDFAVAELGQGDWTEIGVVLGTGWNNLDAAVDKALSGGGVDG
jgi:hypothetical protein